MIVRLGLEQVAKHWDIIKYAAEQSLPPIAERGEHTMNNLLQACLADKMQVWIAYEPSDDAIEIKMVIITTVVEETCSGVNNLMIYVMFAYKPLKWDEWLDGLEKLALYGKSIGCTKLIGYTQSKILLEKAMELGADTTWTLASFKL